MTHCALFRNQKQKCSTFMNGSSSHGFVSVICITSYKDMVVGLQLFCWSFWFLGQVLSLNNSNEQSDTGLRQGPLGTPCPSSGPLHTPKLCPLSGQRLVHLRGQQVFFHYNTKDGTSLILVALSAQHLGLWLAMRSSQSIFHKWINTFRILTTFASSMISRSKITLWSSTENWHKIPRNSFRQLYVNVLLQRTADRQLNHMWGHQH